jgi:hypothetical protein
MLDAKHELELELSGGRPLPSPPMRAAPPAPPIAPAPASAPLVDAAPPAEAHPAPPAEAAAAPSTRSEMSPEQLTATLASLADLRDRGAISAEEYEAKKADLLRRL